MAKDTLTPLAPAAEHPVTHRLVRLGIDTQQEYYVYLNWNSPICKSEGFEAQTRILVSCCGRSIIATLNIVRSDLLALQEVGLSESAWRALNASEGDEIHLSHLPPIDSMRHVRAKIFGHVLTYPSIKAIIDDVCDGRYSQVHMAAFVTACANGKLSLDEITDLTRAMVDAGEIMSWDTRVVADKHCVGGLPGNRTTPIVVAIVAAAGLTIPKTSSRAITSPAGTADTMETLAPVVLNPAHIREVVAREGACLAWGGSGRLSPADDILIRVEKAIGIDVEGQMIASILSKKVASGATHVVIDVPVGPTAKVRSHSDAERLRILLELVAARIGLTLKVEITDGSQPVGRGIGPALEARDVLSVLHNEAQAPKDLKERALTLAGSLLELTGRAQPGHGQVMAREILEDGRAWNKFEAICKAQGELRSPPVAPFVFDVKATQTGMVTAIDNRQLATVAKLAGAPDDRAAGVEFLAPLGTPVKPGQVLYRIHAESEGELAFAMDYALKTPGAIITVAEA